MKRFLLFLGGLALLFLVSIGLVASCVVRAGSSMGFGTMFDEKATRVEDHPLEVASGGRLEVDLPLGDVHVRSSAGARGSLKATITARASTQEEAKARAAQAEVRIEPASDGVRITFDARREKVTFGQSRSSVDLEILVPDGVRLDLRSNSGDIRAEGAFAASTAHSSYGDIDVRGVEGDLEATSKSGDVRVVDVRGPSVEAKTAYGDVELRGCSVERIEAESSSGDVKLEGWKGSRASLDTKYGDVFVSGATGELDAKSSSGDVEVAGFEGGLFAKSGYGDVRVEGVLSVLGAEARSGDVVVRARSGSRVEGTWKIESSYGAAELSVPEGLGLELDASTGYGDVDVDVPVVGSPGVKKAGTKSLQGKVNGGGGLVEIRCRSGDVRVHSGGT